MNIVNILLEYAPANIVAFLFFHAILKKKKIELILAVWLTFIIMFIGPGAKVLFNVMGIGSKRPKCQRISSAKDLECSGMPSAHSMFAGFLAGYVNQTAKKQKTKTIVSALGILIAGQRVLSKRHTLLQALVGFTLGVTGGSVVGNVQSEL